jgi:hypothetical protein
MKSDFPLERKFSDHNALSDAGFNKNRFCLRSVDSNSVSEMATLTFISPLKMRAAFGPETDKLKASAKKKGQVIKTCPTSPIPTVFDVSTQPIADRLSLSKDMKKLLVSLGLTDQKLLEMSSRDVEAIEGLSEFERAQLGLWKEKLAEEVRERDIFRLIDDFNCSKFKKGEKEK